MSTVEKQKYREVPEGRGGLLTFPDAGPDQPKVNLVPSKGAFIRHVGTMHCRTCVGVYIPITKFVAFVAHINAYKAYKVGGSSTGRYAVEDDAMGEKIKAFTVKKLQEHAKKETWDLSFVDKRKVVMVCPEAEKVDRGGKVVKQVGWWVVEGIKEFLGLEAGVRVDQRFHGFIVRHDSDEAAVMVGSGGKEEEEQGYTAIYEAGLRSWVWDLDVLRVLE